MQSEDQEALEKLASTIIKEKQPFERLEMAKTDILEMFKYSKFKVHFINERVPDGSTSTVYRCGSLIDFCRGPHVRHTGITKAFSVLRVSLSSSLLAFCEGTSVFLELIRILARRQQQRVRPANRRHCFSEQQIASRIQDISYGGCKEESSENRYRPKTLLL